MDPKLATSIAALVRQVERAAVARTAHGDAALKRVQAHLPPKPAKGA